jgi:photosystem II stability/assembly factor-like uncharacterized protein
MLDGHALACSAAAPGTVFLANRMGLFRSDDGGAHWADIEVGRFSPLTYGRDLRVSPHDPEVLYAALSPAFRSYDGGIFRSDDVGRTWRRFDRGGSWQRLALPNPTADVWSITVHPSDRRTIYAGFGPIGVYRSDDGGDRWQQLADPGLPDRVHMTFPCRVMRLGIDPARPDDVYASIEANGAMKSRDRGESWEDLTADLLRFTAQPKKVKGV